MAVVIEREASPETASQCSSIACIVSSTDTDFSHFSKPVGTPTSTLDQNKTTTPIPSLL